MTLCLGILFGTTLALENFEAITSQDSGFFAEYRGKKGVGKSRKECLQ